jgi:hypothetical protein
MRPTGKRRYRRFFHAVFSCRFLMPAISPEPFNQAYFIDIKPPLIFPVYAVLIF